ncbi:MAG: beta-N-acetylhexosaminidase [Gemmatimonadota bacterium]
MRTLLALAVAASAAGAQPSTLLPVPRSMSMPAMSTGPGLKLDSSTVVSITGFRNERLGAAVAWFRKRLEERIGVPIAPTASAATGSIIIQVTAAGQRIQGPEENESYSVAITTSSARVRAPTVVGAIRAMETLLQLISGDQNAFHIPQVNIEDSPRFPWRGLLVDVGRHFMPVEQIKRTLDGMAMVKLNVLHWHLSEDQGFRVESRRYPKLHLLGSDGLYYTQEELREVVAYARDRGIRVVPEFDMPGHSTAWFVGYPQYASRTGPISIRREWGGADAIFDPTRESVYLFIDQFIGEMVRIFPDPYWHIGGDEVEGRHWNGNASIAAFKRRRGWDNAALQAYFNRRMTRILTKYGKRMIGWDEVIHPDLPRATVVQSWRGVEYLGRATDRGFASILSAPWYLDHIKPATDFYLADPIPDSTRLAPATAKLILGGEACMWSEFVSFETTDSRLWPRLGAVAERLWSRQDVRDVGDMYRRLDILAGRLEAMGIRAQSHSARMLRKLLPDHEIAPVESLLTAVQPPFFGQRLNGVGTNQLQPLTRIVDAARPDPPGRWLVERLVRRINQSALDKSARDSLTRVLTMWRDNTPAVRALAASSPLVAQALPAANALERTTLLGLEALRHLAAGTQPPAEWVQLALAELKGYEQPQGLLRVAIVAEITSLVATWMSRM